MSVAGAFRRAGLPSNAVDPEGWDEIARVVADAMQVGDGYLTRRAGRLRRVDPFSIVVETQDRAGRVARLVEAARGLLDQMACAHTWDQQCARCATTRPLRWALSDVAAPATPTPADPDRPCAHDEMTCHVEIARITESDDDPEPRAFGASIRARCVACGEPFCWIMPPDHVGMMPDRPMIDPTAQELRAPLRPKSAEPSFGLGLPGFQVRGEFTTRDRSDCNPGE